jgi:hypothetical protein
MLGFWFAAERSHWERGKSVFDSAVRINSGVLKLIHIKASTGPQNFAEGHTYKTPLKKRFLIRVCQIQPSAAHFASERFLGDFLFSRETSGCAAAGVFTARLTMICSAVSFLP